MADQPTVEELTALYGEHYRKLIAESLAFLDEHEPTWKLSRPIDRGEYVATLIQRAKVEVNKPHERIKH